MPMWTGGHCFVVLCMLMLLAYPSPTLSMSLLMQTSKLRLKTRSDILKTSGGKRKPKLFRVLLISKTYTSSKQQRLSMSRAHTPLQSQDETFLKDDTGIQQRRREHFELLQNRETMVTKDTILSIPQHPERPSLDILPTPDEVQGTKSDCGKYRSIALPSIPGKLLARVLLNRFLPLSEDILPESQCGFRTSQGTMDMIVVARQIQEKCPEQNKDLYMAVTDLTKAFDSINSEALWKVLSRFGCQLYHNPGTSARKDTSNCPQQR